jgi:DivIVA domain-containing protein
VFLFLLIAMVVVVAAVTLAVIGGGDSAALPEAAPEQLVDPLPPDRPVGRADVEALRLPVALRGYRMADVDDALGRLGAELAERDARIAELTAALAGPLPGGAEPYRGAAPAPYDRRPDGFREAADAPSDGAPGALGADGPDGEPDR